MDHSIYAELDAMNPRRYNALIGWAFSADEPDDLSPLERRLIAEHRAAIKRGGTPWPMELDDD